MKTPSPGAIRAYSKEYDTQSPAGKNVHEGFAGGGRVSPDLKPSNPSPYGGERMLRPGQKLRDAKANRKEAEAEGRRYAAGGMVGCKQTRGFGKARRGS
jgi:hypothetical protein